jgi:hypothetical protein
MNSKIIFLGVVLKAKKLLERLPLHSAQVMGKKNT